MDWTRQVDGYCERLDFTFWAEPLNAFTNLAFLIAALLLTRHHMKDGAKDPGNAFLITTLWAIGFGSFAFHTFATVWAGLADVLPIAVYIFGYVTLILRRLFAVPWWQAAIGPMVLMAYMLVLAQLPIAAAPSYAAALAGLLTVAALAQWQKKPAAARGLLTAAAVFTLSLTARSLDEPLCASVSFGTHFLWHILNAVTLYITTRTYMRARP